MNTVPQVNCRHSPAKRRPITKELKPSIIPVTILQVSTIKAAQNNPDKASTKSAKFSFDTLLNINKPTYIKAGAVAYAGTK